MAGDLRAFLSRATVLELFVAFGLAGAVVYFVNQLVYGWILTPITQSASDFGVGTLDFVIGGRQFQSEGIVASGAALLLLALGAALWVRRADGEPEFRECPSCLSEIPLAASVCAYCTRELPLGED